VEGEGIMMRASTGAACMLAAALAGCATSPGNYASGLSGQDPKWQSPECAQARMAALEYEAREKQQMDWGTGLLFGPYGIGLVTAIKENQQKQRKRFAREVHLQCSSLPLPKELQVEAGSQAGATKYP
jgi:hypothetical protein